MRANLAMALHFHQPIGNFDDVINKACDNCYLPFLKTLKEYPKIKMTFHFSGCLLEWIEKNRKEILDIVAEMVKNSQVEIMSGEPWSLAARVTMLASPFSRALGLSIISDF